MSIYEKTPGALIAQPGRTVSTFPSGLIRVDQSFMCTSAAASTHRASLVTGAVFPGDTAPSVDGLSIFQHPQETHTGDGLVEFKVSAYGITDAKPSYTLKPTRTGYNMTTAPGVTSYSVWGGSGTMAVRIGGDALAALRDELYLDPDFLLPFNINFTDKKWKVLSITEYGNNFRILERTRSLPGGKRGAGVWTYELEGRSRYYKITYSADGVTATGHCFAWIGEPDLNLDGKAREYGDFMEIDFTIRRVGYPVENAPGLHPDPLTSP